MKYLLKNAHLVVDNAREYINGALLIEDEIIKDVFPQSNKVENIEGYEIIDLNGKLVMPGFFDSHTHGIAGISFDECNKEQLDEVSLKFAQSGSTSYLASISYDCPIEKYDERFTLYNDYQSKDARFVGIHLEGPFLSKLHLGLGNPDKFLSPNIELVKDILNKSKNLKQMSIAYELDGAKQIGQLLHDNNIKVMCGHSDALCDDLDNNVDGFTHLFNAMRGLHHRDNTLINCAFSNNYYCELICDGNHVAKDVLKLVINNIDKDKIMIVTDSSIARGLPDGEHVFLSKQCIKKGTSFKTLDGHFAGSVVSINDEMKILYELGAKYTDLLAYSSYNAFKFYGLDSRFGTIQKGKYADIVIMDDELNIEKVYCKGKFVL